MKDAHYVAFGRRNIDRPEGPVHAFTASRPNPVFPRRKLRLILLMSIASLMYVKDIRRPSCVPCTAWERKGGAKTGMDADQQHVRRLTLATPPDKHNRSLVFPHQIACVRRTLNSKPG